MNAKKILVLVFVVAVAAVVAGIYFTNSRTEDVVAEQTPSPKSPAVAEAPAPTVTPAPETKPEIQPAQTEVKPVARSQKPATQNPQPAPPQKQKEPLQDPAARVALACVGADPGAEAYWLGAIYDTSLPDAEREDLMEDLNEDGLSDPKHPGPQDLPLILNRLALIEQIAPNADDFMLEHLGEAYKDLLNLSAVAMGGGQPVN
jgi:hypothetical protein